MTLLAAIAQGKRTPQLGDISGIFKCHGALVVN